jgi:hypothetical protein
MKNHPQQQPAKEALNDVCKDCLKWHHYQETCRVYWDYKKFCTMKVRTNEEWDAEMALLKR